MNDNNRASFEAWASNFPNIRLDRTTSTPGDYVSERTEELWLTWNANRVMWRPSRDSFAYVVQQIENLPTRQEPLGGQQTTYVQRDSVIAWLEGVKCLPDPDDAPEETLVDAVAAYRTDHPESRDHETFLDSFGATTA